MDIDPQMVEVLQRCVKSLDETSRKLDMVSARYGPTSERSQVGNSTVHIQAGGWLVIALMMVSMFVLGYCVKNSDDLGKQMTKIEQRQNEQDQYLHAIYMMAPQLKPKEKQDEHAKQ